MHTKYLDTAIDLAKRSGAIQMEGLGKAHDLQFKVGSDIVTEVDKACEKLIVDGIAKDFPGHDILAEEGSGGRRSSEYRWIIDPLDGTSNFAHAYPHFATSIALEHKGEIIIGVIFDPNRNELFVAEKGKGATLNGRRIKVSDTSELKNALLDTGFAYNKKVEEQEHNVPHFIDFLRAAHTIRRDGAAALDLCYVACGRFDGFWELYLKPWDIAAGSLLVKEAGGEVSLFNGSKFDIYGTQILASNGKLHEKMVKVLTRSK